MSGDDNQETAEDFSLSLSDDLLAAAVEAVEKRMSKPKSEPGEDGDVDADLDVELTDSEGDIELDLDLDESLDLDGALTEAAATQESIDFDADADDGEDVSDEDSEFVADAERLQILAKMESLEAERDSAGAALAHKEKEIDHLRNVAEKLRSEVTRLKELNLKLSVRNKRMKEGYERQRLRHEDALTKVRQWEELLGKARGTIRAQEEEVGRTRVRHQREIEETRTFGNEGFFKELLPVLDNMDLALAHSDQTPPDKMVEGVTMIYAQLEGTLRRMGLVKVDPSAGDAFDPTVHEAMKHVESDDIEGGAVFETLQTGFLLKDRLVRAARVSVSSGSATDEPPVHETSEVADTDVEAAAHEE